GQIDTWILTEPTIAPSACRKNAKRFYHRLEGPKGPDLLTLKASLPHARTAGAVTCLRKTV
ncbi:MAG: hypothetical protein VX035_00725, partial [Planctomycetota bacterium]|nr:hypothetical protein [Planctomycetota bacterium]